MNKEVQLDDVMQIIAEKLESGGTVTFSPRGTSMLPMLRDGDDTVVLSKPQGRLRLFDLPLYRRKNGAYVLHRVVNFGDDGSYVMCGDNQFALERGITDDDIIAVVTAFYRGGKAYTPNSLSYRIYLEVMFYTRPLRHAVRAVHGRAKRLIGKISAGGGQSGKSIEGGKSNEKTPDR